MEVASRIVVMNKGVIEQVGTPEEVYEHPRSPFVSRFLGDVNIFHGRIDKGWLELDLWRVPAPADSAHRDEVAAYVRPHDVQVTREADPLLPQARVLHIHHAGSVYKLELEILGHTGRDDIEVEISRREYQELNVQVGDTVYLKLANPRIYPLDKGPLDKKAEISVVPKSIANK
jgi:sulfate transport system ATP-binding protein